MRIVAIAGQVGQRCNIRTQEVHCDYRSRECHFEERFVLLVAMFFGVFFVALARLLSSIHSRTRHNCGRRRKLWRRRHPKMSLQLMRRHSSKRSYMNDEDPALLSTKTLLFHEEDPAKVYKMMTSHHRLPISLNILPVTT